MKHISFSFGFFMIAATSAQADCYADYKAKQDNPLRLHYGVIEVSGPCTTSSAEAQLATQLANDGWQLLNVIGTFDEAGLDERKDSAGEFFLRY